MAADEIAVEVVYAAAPHQVVCRSLRLPVGTTVTSALRASGLLEQIGAAQLAALKAGVWGRVVAGSTVLRDGDRVELTRPLSVDPKEARRLRYRRDGLKRKPPVSGNRSR
jgi:putative ubiquitin-RnfH superfamily antitoxin RatB of RatAB toxin-antitoxin module